MQRRLDLLSHQQFDALIIGGGISGAWIALDCAQRGLRVALVEQQDFGAGTSAKSSKLIHGGIRYLQQLRFDKVRESALERAYYHHAAPHLTQFLPFAVPTYRTPGKSKPLLLAGLAAYQLLCIGENRIAADAAKKVPRPYHLSRREALGQLPLDDSAITGAVVFSESHMNNSERMTLAVLEHAMHSGAVCANYVAVTEPIVSGDDHVVGMVVEDRESGQRFNIRAHVTVNAAGPWAARLNQQLFGTRSPAITTGYSRGSHIVTRRLVEGLALALPSDFAGQNIVDRGGRHLFIIPWRDFSLIGTSYVSTDAIDDPTIDQEEIDQLLGVVNRHLPTARLTRQDILHTFSGIYPLQCQQLDERRFQGTGDYQIIDHEKLGYRGMITALGAKYTTARRVGERAAHQVCRQLATIAAEERAKQATGQPNSTRPTRQIRLRCARYSDLAHYREERAQQLRNRLDARQVNRLIDQYGSNIETLAQSIEKQPALAETICDDRPNLRAEIQYAVQSEMALRLDDVIYRRTGIGTIGAPGSACSNAVADIMSDLLGWNSQRRNAEIARLNLYQRGVHTQ